MGLEGSITDSEQIRREQQLSSLEAPEKDDQSEPGLISDEEQKPPATTRRILQVSSHLIGFIKAALDNLSPKDLQKGGVTPQPPLKRLEPTRDELVEGRLPAKVYQEAIEKCMALFLQHELTDNPGVALELDEKGDLVESSPRKSLTRSQIAQQGLFMYYAEILQSYLDEEHLSGPIRVEESPLGTIVQNGGEPLFLSEVFSRLIRMEDVNDLLEAKKNGAMCLPIIAPEILKSEPGMGSLVYLIAESLDRAVNKRIAHRKEVLKKIPGYVFNDFEFIAEEEVDEDKLVRSLLEMTIDQDNSNGPNPPPTAPKAKMEKDILQARSMRSLLEQVKDQFDEHQEYLHESLDQYTPQSQREEDQKALARHLPPAETDRQHGIREMLEVLVPRLYADMLDPHSLLVSAVMAHLDEEPYNVKGMYDPDTLATAIGKYGVGGLKGRVLKKLQSYEEASKNEERIMTEGALNILEELAVFLNFPKGPHAAAASALLYKDIRIEEPRSLRFELSEVISQAGGGKEQPDSLDHIARIYIAFRRILDSVPDDARGSQRSITWFFWKLTGHMQSRKIMMNGEESETHTPLVRGHLHDILSLLYQHAHPEASESNFLIHLLIDIIEKPASVWMRDGLFEKYLIQQKQSLKTRCTPEDEQAFIDWYDRRMNAIQTTTIKSFRERADRSEWTADIAQETEGFVEQNATITQSSTEWLIRSHEQLSEEMSRLILTKIRQELPETLRVFGYEGIAFIARVVINQVHWAIASSF